MADLILKNSETDSSSAPGCEHDYEFDPGDSAAIERIHVVLSLRKSHHVQNSEKLLALFCARTTEQNKF